MEQQSLIIVGGGVAGLMAARQLAGHYSVLVLEARPQLGGRIRSQQPQGFSGIIEAGAEFIHGPLPLTMQLLKEAGIGPVPVTGSFYRKEKGQWKEQAEMIGGWDKLIGEMKRVKKDMTMYDFLQQHFGDDRYADLRRHAIAFTEGFDIADIRKVSVQSLYKEWSQEGPEENFRIPGGYGALVRFLHEECERKGCRILTNQMVKQIDWEPGEVTVYTLEEKFDAQKAIVTVPVSVLRKAAGKAAINFTPPLDNHVKAANEIGVGAVVKVVLQFQQPFWKEEIGFVLSDERIPTWWTQPGEIPVLTGWAGGTRAEKLAEHTDEEILEKALLSLSAIFEKPVAELKQNLQAAAVFNWLQEEEALGAYCYATPDTPEALQLLNEPVAGTLWFAGEGLYQGASPGTVEAALMSGKEVAAKLLKN